MHFTWFYVEKNDTLLLFARKISLGQTANQVLATIKRRKKFLDVVPSADDGVVEETNGEDTTGENDGGNTFGGGTNTGGDNTDDDADDGSINGGDDI